MNWQITFEYTEPINSNQVQITVYAKDYDEGVNKAVSLDAPRLYKKSLRLIEAIEMDEELILDYDNDDEETKN